MLCDPISYSCADLESLPGQELHRLARQAAGSLVKCRLLLGRCIVAIGRSEAYLDYGCNGALHYAQEVLRLEESQAREFSLVARRLETLPVLTEAAQQGAISWSALREVVRRATPENEGYWLQKARECTMRLLERMLRQAAPADEVQGADKIELRMVLTPEVMAMFQRVMRLLSHQACRPISFNEALEYMCAENLAGSPESIREEARRDVAAEQEAPWAVVAAREEPVDGTELQLVRSERPHWSNDRLRFHEESRLATPAQRRELLRRDGYRCSTPGCHHTLWLHVHHVIFYSAGGATVPANTVVVCSSCHRNIHRQVLRVSGTAPGGLTWQDGAGRVLGKLRLWETSPWLEGWWSSG